MSPVPPETSDLGVRDAPSSSSLAGEPWPPRSPPAALGALLLTQRHRAAPAPRQLEIDRGDAGWTVARIDGRASDVLQRALAEREPFAVAMQLGVERPAGGRRPPRRSSLEEVLRDVLRGRNHDRWTAGRRPPRAVSRVELLLLRARRDIMKAGVARLDLSAEDAARVGAQQRMREQQMFARLRSAKRGRATRSARN